VPPAGVAAALLRFATRDWWRLVAGSLRYAATAAGLLAAALLAAVAWTLADPRAAERTLPVADRRIPLAAAPRGLADATGLPRGIPALPASWTPAAALALAVLALAGGLLAGLGTVAALGALGLQLGVPAGLALGSGQGAPLAGLLAADGLLLLVLTCLVAGEGLRLGLAVVDPGRRPRGEAVVAAARRGTLVLAGALPAYGVAALLAAAVRADGPWPVAPGGLVAVAALAAGTARLGRPRHARSAARPEE